MKTSRLTPRAITRTKPRALSNSGVKEILAENPEVLAAMIAVPVMAGLWAVASFIGAIITAGSPLALIMGWLQAVTGM